MKYIYNRSLRDIATFVVKTKVRKLDNGRLHILSFQIQSHMRSSMLRFYRKNRKTECLWIRKLKSHQHSMYIASIFWKKELTAGMLEGGGRGGARPSRFWPHPYCPWKMVHWPVRSPVQACCRPCRTGERTGQCTIFHGHNVAKMFWTFKPFYYELQSKIWLQNDLTSLWLGWKWHLCVNELLNWSLKCDCLRQDGS